MTRNVPDDFPTVDNPPRYEPTGAITTLSPIVDVWPCRRCGVDVTVTDAAIDARERMNKLLRARGEQEMATNECVYCDRCSRDRAKARAAHSAKLDVQLREACERLRDHKTPDHVIRESELFVERVANSGSALVVHYREVRNKAAASSKRGGDL